MGMVLGFALLIGVIAGALVSALLVGAAVILTRKAARTRAHAWRTFIVSSLLFLPILLLAVYHYPYDTGTPGSNYSILFKHFSLIGFLFTAAPGVAALLALAAVFGRRKTLAVPAAAPSRQPSRETMS